MSQYLTISDAAQALRSGETTSVELVERAIEVADASDSRVGYFIARFVNQSRAAARAADEALQAGAIVGPLHGIPLGIKDIITTEETTSTAQSLVLDPAWSHGDALVAARLRSAGGVLMGKMTTMEFALGLPDASTSFPLPRNPWKLDRWAGGSSSGSGSAVAAGAVLGALGTDTGGSIRIPAAFCGITGLMPTFGRVPKSGCVPLGYSLDHIGPMARSARDCALMLGVLAGHDTSDLSSIDVEVPDYAAGLTGDLTGLRIGVDRLTRVSGVTEDAQLPTVFSAATEALENLGAELVEIGVPFYEEITAATIVILLSEAMAYHLPDLQSRWADYAPATRSMIAGGALYSGADYVQAQRARRVAQKALAELYRDVDLIVTPTSSAGATAFSDIASMLQGVSGAGLGPIHTPYWNSTGNPVLSVPMGFTADGMPLGMQIAGRPFDETTVLRAGDAFQRATNWHLQLPALE